MKKFFAFIVISVALIYASTTMAAKPVEPYLSGPLDPTTMQPLTTIHYGDSVYFDHDDVNGGWLIINCYINDTHVLTGIHAAYDDGSAYGYHVPFQLGPTYVWDSLNGAAASCNVSIKIAKKASVLNSKSIASVDFNVIEKE